MVKNKKPFSNRLEKGNEQLRRVPGCRLRKFHLPIVRWPCNARPKGLPLTLELSGRSSGSGVIIWPRLPAVCSAATQ